MVFRLMKRASNCAFTAPGFPLNASITRSKTSSGFEKLILLINAMLVFCILGQSWYSEKTSLVRAVFPVPGGPQMYKNAPRLRVSICLERKSWISARSDDRAASFPGTLPRWRTALARVKIVFLGVEGVDDGVRVGLEPIRLVGVKREMVRLADTGVAGRPFRQQC